LAWNVELIDTAKRQLAKLDRKWQAAILDYLEDEINRSACGPRPY
jgi:mRNA interferase RelE/StbE